MIKAIFFDLDGTIRHNEPRGFDVFATQAVALGLRVRQDDLLRALRWENYYWARSLELRDDLVRFGDLTPEFWVRYSHRQLVALGASSKQAVELARRMSAFMDKAYHPESVVPHELPALLTALSSAGFKLGVISNRDKPLPDVLAKIGLAEYFPYSLASGEIGSWKPDPEIFLHACGQVGVAPSEAAYVGDNYFADVVGAKRARLVPILYDPRGIFDDPECAVIGSFDELPRALSIEVALPDSRASRP